MVALIQVFEERHGCSLQMSFHGIRLRMSENDWLNNTGKIPSFILIHCQTNAICISRQSYRELRSKWLDDPEVKESVKFQDQKHRIGMSRHDTYLVDPY